MQSRTCLVTGAGRGIGRAVALRLSGAGHRVALTARDERALNAVAAELPGAALVVPADITEPGSVDRVVDRIEQHWGPVEVLVANAGAGSSAPLARTGDEDWQRMLDLNLTAPFRCLRRTLPAMTANGWGRVVVVASTAARVGEPYIAAYTASKHGVLGLVRAAASEVVRKGVTVNAVCPGYVDTPMTEATIATICAHTGRDPDSVRKTLADKQPLGRLIDPDEVAVAVLSFVDNPAITGQALNIDGGGVQS
ncbi:SDR family NAD(P)-dependent oxidoreductase [Kutzneria viridogrisea]|uniref:Short-chain dehydrogenase/reductase SDR n=2 Tax=Kutzneria TaxID=43356 RepID=W5W7C6_9PSEU|nr:SDR family NAD(P)-dependent oxidoreductase [Kutzneria albida]AHH96817.1 short-chain dehydrogenase/reductase SDR [Kutzneria albida DSM 43870]MBA8927962.1 NAD(P)-dependent dehydrogenase (short-subunit alcohol dehydrogenase family) [Kutzneria viridogrisea]